MKKYLISAAVAVSAICGGNANVRAQEVNDPSEDWQSDKLIVYYSQTGATKEVAAILSEFLYADVQGLYPEEPYPDDYDATVKRWLQEKEEGKRVEINNPLAVDLEDYDIIFLGFPVWGGSYPPPIATFLEDYSLKGKKIVTFVTFGSGGLETATADVAKAQPDADVKAGYGVRNIRLDKARDEIRRFLIEEGYMDGEITPLPSFGAKHKVTADEKAIFEAACAGYKFPLGTPVEAAVRNYDGTTEYRFDVATQTPTGAGSAVVYVLAEPNEPPVFTKVVR